MTQEGRKLARKQKEIQPKLHWKPYISMQTQTRETSFNKKILY